MLGVGAALKRDEDESIDFKQEMPPACDNDARRKLAREFAGFSTEEGGTIYFGVTDARDVIGMPEADDAGGRDEFRKRIDTMCRSNIQPAIVTRVRFLPYSRSDGTVVVVPAVVIPPGPEPVYYVGNRPYVRRGQETRPAEPHEVTGLYSRHFLQLGWRPPELEPPSDVEGG